MPVDSRHNGRWLPDGPDRAVGRGMMKVIGFTGVGRDPAERAGRFKMGACYSWPRGVDRLQTNQSVPEVPVEREVAGRLSAEPPRRLTYRLADGQQHDRRKRTRRPRIAKSNRSCLPEQ